MSIVAPVTDAVLYIRSSGSGVSAGASSRLLHNPEACLLLIALLVRSPLRVRVYI